MVQGPSSVPLPPRGPLLSASLRFPQLWGQGWDLLKGLANRTLWAAFAKTILKCHSRGEGRDSGNPRISRSECSSRILPIPGDQRCPSLISATKGAQGLSVRAVPWDYYNLGLKAPAPTQPTDLAVLTFLLPAASGGSGRSRSAAWLCSRCNPRVPRSSGGGAGRGRECLCAARPWLNEPSESKEQRALWDRF